MRVVSYVLGAMNGSKTCPFCGAEEEGEGMIESIEQLREEIQILRGNNIDTDELVMIADAIEREVEERYVELPRDKDGERVSIGDTVHDHEEGYDFKVDGFMFWTNTTEWWVFQDQAVQQKLSQCSVVKPPTVEDMLRVFADRVRNESMKFERVSDETIAEYAERLQLREDE